MYEFYTRCLISIWKALYLYRTSTSRTSAIKSLFRIFSFSFVSSNIENLHSCHRASKVFFQKCSFSLSYSFLYIFIRIIEHRESSRKPCHSRGLDLPLIQNDRAYPITTHDEDDHWAKTTTLIKFRDMTYWSHQIKNVKRYIDKCLICARHESATRFQLLNSIHVFQSFQLADLNFIDALSKTLKRNSFILHFMNYFSRFSVVVTTSTANVEDVISTLKHIFNAYQKSMKIYCDESQHFFNEELKKWLKSQRIKLTLSFFESSQNTELIENENKFLKAILRKDSNKEWNLILNRFTNKLNSWIIEHLELFSTDILMKFRSSVFVVDSTLLTLSNQFSAEEVLYQLNQSLVHRKVIRIYFIYRAQIYDRIRQLFKKQKKKEVEKFNKKITKHIVHKIESLVMLYQKKHTKLTFKWRDFFQIFEYEDTHQISFVLIQLNDRKIRKTFHENHLKEFKSRTEYLSNSSREKDLLLFQTIRMSKSKKKKGIERW